MILQCENKENQRSFGVFEKKCVFNDPNGIKSVHKKSFAFYKVPCIVF